MQRNVIDGFVFLTIDFTIVLCICDFRCYCADVINIIQNWKWIWHDYWWSGCGKIFHTTINCAILYAVRPDDIETAYDSEHLISNILFLTTEEPTKVPNFEPPVRSILMVRCSWSNRLHNFHISVGIFLQIMEDALCEHGTTRSIR